MKKTIIWIASVVALVVIADIIFGYATRKYKETHDLGGDYTSLDYLLKGVDDSVLVLGSSVALNSINTMTLTDSIGVTCYNASCNGQTMPYFLTMMQEIAEMPKRPSRVLLGLHPADLMERADNNGRYTFLVPYYGIGYKHIDQGLRDLSPENSVLLHSNLYRYNTIWFRILLYRFISPNLSIGRGFIAKPVPSIFPTHTTLTEEADINSKSIDQLTEIIKLCNDSGIRLSVFMPPVYTHFDHQPKAVAILDSICNAHRVPLYNDRKSQPFLTDSTLFYDAVHLNVNGAEIYTRKFIGRLAR